MEIRDLCIQILGAQTLEDKLFSPLTLTDQNPGPAIFWNTPSRPVGMEFKRHSREEKLPPFHEHGCKDKRAICLHRFAGHELLAVEIMAYALLAFPEAPKYFRKGLLNTLKEEQEHVRLYTQRLLEMGLKLGDLPLYKHFWSFTPHLRSPLQYLSVMSLTFEMANLDFAPLYGKSFQRHGDIEAAALMDRILQDEMHHVSFGMHWLQKLKDPQDSSWDCWRKNVPEKLTVKRAKGFCLFEEHRRKANVPEDWIANIKNS
jgi:uncharacterized ferritin-like protein (DUF455 family)